MDLSIIAQSVVSFVSSPLGAFVGAVILDDLLGVALAIKTGGIKALSSERLTSFILTQFGTTEAKVLGGIVATATVASVGAHFASGVDITGLAKDAFVAAQLAAGALAIRVLNDCRLKALKLVGI